VNWKMKLDARVFHLADFRPTSQTWKTGHLDVYFPAEDSPESNAWQSIC